MNTKVKAIIIDDEERAVNTLSLLLKTYAPEVEVVATANNVPQGVLAINTHRPDLVFLDIEMPEYNGFELLQFFRDVDFEIIFVTAYSEYALRAFEVSAVDYILKPIEVDALKKAIEQFHKRNKVSYMQDRLDLLKETYQAEEVHRIALPVSEGLVFVELKEIILLEADGSYTNLWLRNGTRMVVSKKLKFFEDLLENRELFYRPHRSFIIHLNAVQKYLKGEGTIILDGNKIVSISRDKKAEFEERLKKLKIV